MDLFRRTLRQFSILASWVLRLSCLGSQSGHLAARYPPLRSSISRLRRPFQPGRQGLEEMLAYQGCSFAANIHPLRFIWSVEKGSGNFIGHKPGDGLTSASVRTSANTPSAQTFFPGEPSRSIKTVSRVTPLISKPPSLLQDRLRYGYIIGFQKSIFPRIVIQVWSTVGSIGCWAVRPASISIGFLERIANGAFTSVSIGFGV